MEASGKQIWRLGVDYQQLNEITIDDKYPIPNEILDRLGTWQYFSTSDLSKGFRQPEVSEEDVEKIAFIVEGGHYDLFYAIRSQNSPSHIPTSHEQHPKRCNVCVHFQSRGPSIYFDHCYITVE